MGGQSNIPTMFLVISSSIFIIIIALVEWSNNEEALDKMASSFSTISKQEQEDHDNKVSEQAIGLPPGLARQIESNQAIKEGLQRLSQKRDPTTSIRALEKEHDVSAKRQAAIDLILSKQQMRIKDLQQKYDRPSQRASLGEQREAP